MEVELVCRMLYALKPAWGEALITDPAAPLPSALPEVIGMNMIEGTRLALSSADPQLRHDCLFEIWDALPDSEVIHRYRGFHLICDLLDEGEEGDNEDMDEGEDSEDDE